ncbi:MAG: hypothetical protein AB7O04_03795 [Hyphomonadaceae bacterium]
MRRNIVAMAFVTLLGALSGCGPNAAHSYPAEARAEFDQKCTAGAEACDCLWGEITQEMTHEEYEAAMARFAEKGLADPRITQARAECLGH